MVFVSEPFQVAQTFRSNCDSKSFLKYLTSYLCSRRSVVVNMANPKNVSALSKKRGRNTATVSPTSYDLTQDESKRRKKHKLSSIGVPVDSTILSAPDLHKKSRRNAVSDTRDDSSIEKVLVSEDDIETKSSGPLSGFDGRCRLL